MMDYRSLCCTIFLIGIMQIGLSVLASDDMVRQDVENNRDTLLGITTEYQIVYPQQVRMSETLSDLSTRDRTAKSKMSHFHHTNIELVMLGRRQKIKLELNKDLLGETLTVETSLDSTRQYREEIPVENCYYQGKVKKAMDILVMVSTCNGIRGVILNQGRASYILPLKPRLHKNETLYPHVLFEAPEPVEELCGNTRGLWQSYQDLHFDQFLRNIKIIKSQGINMPAIVKPLRLGFVVDHALFQRLNGTVAEALSYSLMLANIMDGLMKDLRLSIRLEYVEVWNDHDLAVPHTNPRASLTSLLQYRSKMSAANYNHLHLLTGVQFDNEEFGMAIPDSICSDRSLAVSQVIEVRDILRSAVSVTHLLGHVLGIGHDTLEECSCEDSGRCIMNQKQNGRFDMHATTWSRCNDKSWNQVELSLLDQCLHDSGTDQLQPQGPVNMKSYQQQCGNGITERGEECDCLDAECEDLDPCCDQETCLLRPWATCRWGECCHNCTVRPSNQMCRDVAGECDVPEFCDGRTGECPANALTQDGQQCPVTTDGYCYRGVCQTYADQCRRIWGRDANAADDKCYEMFNTAGRFDGHCGWNSTSGEMLKCLASNIKCGLLHCSNGTDKPLLSHNWTFSLTHVGAHGADYQCKVLVSDTSHASDAKQAYDQSSVAMVSDGTRCGSTSLCVASQCADVSRVMPVTCPRGPNGLICSKRGVCTTDVRCYCSQGYGGIDCSQPSNWTFIPLITTTLFPASPSLPPSTTAPALDPGLPSNLTESILPYHHPHLPLSSTTTAIITTLSPVQSLERSTTTLWLIIVMGSVVVTASVLLAVVVLCCRRAAPASRRKKQQAGGVRQGAGSNSRLSHITNSSDGVEASNNRLISFGKLPSYREYKQKRAQRGISASETESEHSRGAGAGDRSSGEIKSAPPALNKNPEKGILKNRGKGAKRRSKELERLSQLGVESVPETVAQIEPSESVPLTSVSETQQTTNLTNPDRFMTSLESDDDETSSCCSCEDHDSSNASESDVRTGRSSGLESIEEERNDRGVSDHRRSNEQKKALLQNLARQIDSQFHLQTDYLLSQENDRALDVSMDERSQEGRQKDPSRHQRSQSPAHSDDRSETEADRCLAPDSFYRQSDSLNRNNGGSAFIPAKSSPFTPATKSSPLIRAKATNIPSQRGVTTVAPLAVGYEVQNRGSNSPRSTELSRKKFFESTTPTVSNTANVFSPIQRIGALPSAASARGSNSGSPELTTSVLPAPQPRRLAAEGRFGQIGPPVCQSTPLADSSRLGSGAGQHLKPSKQGATSISGKGDITSHDTSGASLGPQSKPHSPSQQFSSSTSGKNDIASRNITPSSSKSDIPPRKIASTSIGHHDPSLNRPQGPSGIRPHDTPSNPKQPALSAAHPTVPYQSVSTTPQTTDSLKTRLTPERHIPSQSALSVFNRPSGAQDSKGMGAKNPVTRDPGFNASGAKETRERDPWDRNPRDPGFRNSRERDPGHPGSKDYVSETMGMSTTSSKGSRGSDDGSIVVREIPKNRSFEMRFIPDARGAYTKAPGSPGSPEDIDV